MSVRTKLAPLLVAYLASACGEGSFVSKGRDGSASGARDAGPATGGNAGPSSGGTSAGGGSGRSGAGGTPSAGGGTKGTGGRTSAGGNTTSTGGTSAGGGTNTGGNTMNTGGNTMNTGGSTMNTGGSGMGGSGGSGGSCMVDCAPRGLVCCRGVCVNAQNDPKNCGGCGHPCDASVPYCNLGKCEVPQCLGPAKCQAGTTCCAAGCCGAGQICCLIMQGPWSTECVDSPDGTCPVGCPNCACAAPDTPVATPSGERAIAELRVNDLVYSIEGSSIVAVRVRQVNRVPVIEHRVVAVTLADGRRLEISAPHPTADGRTFGDLREGDDLGGVRIVHVDVVPYRHPFTYDILPASETGIYFTAGAAIGSTLFQHASSAD